MARYFGFRGRSLENALNYSVILPSYILFGYNHAVAGGLLSLPSWIETFPALDTINTAGDAKIHNSTVQGTVVAIYTLGCFLGCLHCIWVGDKLGRRGTVLFGAAVNLVGAVLQATSFTLPQLIVGRLLTGFGFSHITATAPNWQAECCKAEHRGAVVMLEGVFISLGLAISAWVNFGMSFTAGSISWRLPLALSALWSVVVLSTAPLMPESPRWLVKKGRLDEARAVLAALGDVDEDAAELASDMDQMRKSLGNVAQARFRDIATNGGDRRLLQRTCLACAGQLFQQMSGVCVLAFYQATIFEQNLGLAGSEARILAAAVFTFQFLVSPVGVLTVDRFGRRRLMMFAAAGMGACMAVVAGTTTSRAHSTAAAGVAAAAIFMFSFFFPVGFLGLTFLYAAEIAPLSHRVPITALSTATAWLFNFIVVEVTPVGLASIQYRYFIIYAAVNFCLTLPSVYFFFPETNGRRLEEIDHIFSGSKSCLDTVKEARLVGRFSPHSSSEEMGQKHESKPGPHSSGL